MRIPGCKVRLACVAAFAVGATVVQATDLYVSVNQDYGSGPGGSVVEGDALYSDIQAAIDAASAGDTVWVKDGFVCNAGATYSSMSNRIYIAKAITLRSQSGTWKGGATIRGAADPTTGGGGDYAVRCLFINCDGVLVKGFRIDGAYAKTDNSGAVYFPNGGSALQDCLICDNQTSGVTQPSYRSKYTGSYPMLTDCVVSNNAGGVSYCRGLRLMICDNRSTGAYSDILTDSRIERNVLISTSNTGYPRGGGASAAILTNCFICANATTNTVKSQNARGGGADGSTLVGCTLTNNWTNGTGGGFGGTCTLIGCKVFDNHAPNGGGGGTTGGVVSNCVFRGNVAADNGGGLYASSSAATDVFGTTFIGNVATTAAGGGMFYYADKYSTAFGVVSNCTFVANTAKSGGGGLSGTGNVVLCADSTFTSNVVTRAAVYNGGGGVKSAVLRNCTVSYNEIRATDSNAYGGAGTCSCVLDGCQVSFNDGHGASAGVTKGSLTNTVVCCNVTTNANAAAWTGSGAGVADVVAVNCIITNNIGQWRGSASYGATCYNCLIAKNRLICTGDSGGAACWGGTYYNCTVVGNTVVRGRGGFDSAPVAVNCIAWDNKGNAAGNDLKAATNCCFDAYTATVSSGCDTKDPRFVATTGPEAWHLRMGSPYRHKGLELGWMRTAGDPRAKDLDGHDRIVGVGPDVGCYERVSKGLQLLVR